MIKPPYFFLLTFKISLTRKSTLVISNQESAMLSNPQNPPSFFTGATAPGGSCNTQTSHPCATNRIPDSIARYHNQPVGQNQCCSAVIQIINAPVATVWSVVRRFDNPQAYKHFVKSCHVLNGSGDVGTLRQVHVISGLPAANSTERLEILDDERHVLSFSVIGGDHRLANYRSVTTLHPTHAGNGTVVVESYVVDIPTGNTKEETFGFVETIVKCNLQSLAKIVENKFRLN